MEDFERELKLEFLAEAGQSLTDTEQCFLSLENDPNNSENLNKIFRLAHNLKGSSKAVGFDQMGAFTHEFETFILKIKNGELNPSAPVVSLLLRCNDHLIKMVQDLKDDLNATFDSTELLQQIVDMKEGRLPEAAPAEIDTHNFQEEVAAEPMAENSIEPVVDVVASNFELPSTLIEELVATDVAATAPIAIEPNLELLAELEEAIAKLQEISDGPPTAATATLNTVVANNSAQKVVQPQPVQPAKPAAVNGATTTQSTSTPPSSGAPVAKQQVDESIRISLSKLENLLNYVGEMVILQSVMREQALRTDSLLLKKTVQQLGKVGKEIQDISMSLRMVPVKPTFQKMQRIVRDTAQALQKDVAITLIGEETELDKTVLEKINDPLVHLIRNSVDHGVEHADIRTSRGKPTKGQVSLSAFHQSGKLVIEVKDDGGGLDPEKLKAKAIEKGIIKPGTALTEREAYNLIFAPGFSTKELVTDVSGRGVGMDVVKTNIHELSGEIEIYSTLGQGTKFQIILPLTLAIIDGMIVTFANEKFVMPLNQVHETLRPTPQQIHFNQGLGHVLMLREENIPLFRLGDFFAKQSKQQTTDMIALVVRTGAHPFALLVDDILGQYQVVVKQLGPELQNLKGISGSTILGDGKPSLILEPQDLIKRTKTNLGPSATQASSTNLGGKAA